MKVERKDNSKVVYYIDEDKKTIACKMNNTEDELIEKCLNNGTTCVIPAGTLYHLQLKNSYSAKTSCLNEDTFDTEKGKRLALVKMLSKYYKDKEKTYENIINEIENYVEVLRNECTHSRHLKDVYEEEYEELRK